MAKTIKRNFPVRGLGCAACVARVQGELKAVTGVTDASVSLASESAQVEYNPFIVKAAELKKVVQSAGYDLIVPEGIDEDIMPEGSQADAEEEAEKARAKAYKRLRVNMWVAIVIAVAVMFIEMGIKEFHGRGLTLFVLGSIAVFACGWRFISNAVTQAMHFYASMDTLVALSTTISWLFSTFNLVFPSMWTSQGLEAELYYGSCSMIVAFILIGRLLEDQAKYGTTASIRALMELQPRRSKAVVGDIVKIKPGQRIPVDGIVLEGDSYVDESLLTGEPIPVLKAMGNMVYTGTINQNGALQVRVEKTGEDTMLSSIIRMVKDAQGSKAKVQRIVDKVAAVFVPIVILIALAAFFGWTFSGGGFAKGLLTMVSVLVIACPCSLGLATPTAIIAGIGRGAQNGILIKDADTLQLARRINAVVLDKTGTITVGKAVVTKEFWYHEEAKGVLKAMEMSSEHPLAAPILDKLSGVKAVNLQSFRAVPGSGAEAKYEGKNYFITGRTELSSPVSEAWAGQGDTLSYFTDGERILAVYAIADEPKEDSAKAVAALKAMKIKTVMLTGDNEGAAKAIAAKVGIDEVKAGMLPADKAEYIKSLQDAKQTVAMVGDGINDSAALAQANVSIAMGKGSDIAMDTAMVTIVSSELSRLPQLISLSRRTVRIIWQNLGWAFVYNIFAIQVAAGLFGFTLNPMISAAAMACSSVLVVTNSLRLKKIKL